MSCTDLFFTPDGRRGIGVNQPQAGMDYPLIAPSADIQYLLADFHIAYGDQPHEIKHPLHIKWLYGLGCDEPTTAPPGTPTPTHAADIVVADANDVIVFDSTTAATFNTWCWGLKKTAACPDSYAYQMYEWHNATTTCQLVAYKTWPILTDAGDSDIPRNYAQHLVPVNAVIDERAVYKKPKQVTSFILVKKNSAPQIVAGPTVEFTAGFNINAPAVAGLERGLRRTNSVTFNATPGAGKGKFVDCREPIEQVSCCNNPVAITSINGLSGPNVNIASNDCLWTRPPLVYVDAAESAGPIFTPSAVFGTLRTVTIDGHTTQQIGSDCTTPCCTCNDYEDVARYMNSTRDRYATIGEASKIVLQSHIANIDRWATQRQCRQTQPLKACMTPQRCPILDVVVQYCNMCEKCVQNVVLNIEFDAGGNTATLACGYTNVSNNKTNKGAYRLGGSWPNFSAPLGNVDAGNSATASFRLEFAQDIPTTVRLNLTGTTSKGVITAGCDNDNPAYTAVVTKALRCDDDGNTPQLCE